MLTTVHPRLTQDKEFKFDTVLSSHSPECETRGKDVYRSKTMWLLQNEKKITNEDQSTINSDANLMDLNWEIDTSSWEITIITRDLINCSINYFCQRPIIYSI